MAKGQHLSAYQQKIVSRYYDNIDTISLHKLSEAVGELYLCESDKKAERLWVSVEKALQKSKVDPKRIMALMATKDVRALAEMVNALSGKK